MFCNKYAIDEMDNIHPLNNDNAGRRRGSMGYQPRMTNGVHHLLGTMEDEDDEDGRLFRSASQQPPQHITANQRNPPHHQLQHRSNEQYPNQHHDPSQRHQLHQHRTNSIPQQPQQPHQLYRNTDEKEDDFDMHPIRHNKRRERPRKYGDTPNRVGRR